MFCRKETKEQGQNSYATATSNSATAVLTAVSSILFIKAIDNHRSMRQLNEKKDYFSITRFKSPRKNSFAP